MSHQVSEDAGAIPRSLNVPEDSLYHMLKRTVKTNEKRIAVIFDEEKVTYGELFDQVNRLADSWRKLGMKKGEMLGLMLPNQTDYIVCFYAAQALGMTVVQINPNYTPRELVQIIHSAKIKRIVVSKTNLDTVLHVHGLQAIETIIVSDAPDKSEDTEELFSLERQINEGGSVSHDTQIDVKEDVAVIQYTGGTTGQMKGAMLTHYNLVANVEQSFTMYGSNMEQGKEVFLVATPLYHVYAMTAGMNLGIRIGATILLMRKFEIQRALEWIKTYRPTYFPGVPGMYTAFVMHPEVEKYGLDCLKFCSSGSAPLPVEIIKRFEALTGAVIGEGFGMSEASPTTHRNPAEGVRKIGSVGLPLPGTESRIVDDDNQELPPKCVGELIIKGPQIMKGYLNNEADTGNSLRNGWLYTGDLAMMDEDGYFYIVGRKKEMILIGGFNVYPREIENVLYEHQDVKEVAVVGIPHEEKGEVIKAFIVLREGATADVEELKGFCYRNLTRYKVPKDFEIRDALPKNTVGKLLKRSLVEEEIGNQKKERDE
ncbi:long-chain-fatty-acid--CoA ligase [Alteribacter keqinensis]|uniref:Long-chain fatty acid--CoA ligase n=1 Tax=Alteribacter keqinensis TaxID=2483800 RepID=A0A3M7TL60_9BACI|nr:long-chain fatty acid--CoA ligase [Alteribacter keqinensis]RNA66218.1 long-chain fatty acid--CoA ligase [Alteribacter keqinensis]